MFLKYGNHLHFRKLFNIKFVIYILYYVYSIFLKLFNNFRIFKKYFWNAQEIVFNIFFKYIKEKDLKQFIKFLNLVKIN